MATTAVSQSTATTATDDAKSSPSPRVSVMMPVYNNAAYVGAAIESIIGQSFTVIIMQRP
jgi:cellulose synthase/poly-beta-1,6-N-acetylglucosamine synthase-like glycosyltransferase